MKLFTILCGASGSQKFKVTAHKPEILIFQSVYNIAAQFHRLYPCFQGPAHQQEILMFMSGLLGFLTYRAPG